MARARQTFERRQLGLALRRLRLDKGVPQKAAAEAIGRSRTKVVELEEGNGTLSGDDLARLLDYYAVSGAEREAMLALGAQARRRKRGRTYVDLLPNSYQRFADLEANAARISTYEPGIVPGLLQSSDYIRAVIEEGDGIWWDGADPGREDRISFRLDRQAVVFGAGEPKDLRFVLTEDSLRADFGAPEVMRGQLRHLLSLCDGRPGPAIRLLRNDTHPNPLRGRALILFDFKGKAPAVGYSEAIAGHSAYYDDPADTAALALAFERVWELAATEPGTERFIRELLEEL
ncbi:transcriptional regulator with XRE-family HTH domain [Saccharothrix coeruleofusca]|uniref:helix-turn-helix domain-containing protein n=1 Tax=Saccharothrix coeruleofusca TaxID=33919 RepID=UPI001AE2EC9D|nr:helix-turn-helix transcriptional regulator [Saccharothrix coeruleofusca]MBP2338647.1 transcriptional regulator with XRE-family HTH domain [Saccharothrix coeruleofusca]